MYKLIRVKRVNESYWIRLKFGIILFVGCTRFSPSCSYSTQFVASHCITMTSDKKQLLAIDHDPPNQHVYRVESTSKETNNGLQGFILQLARAMTQQWLVNRPDNAGYLRLRNKKVIYIILYPKWSPASF